MPQTFAPPFGVSPVRPVDYAQTAGDMQNQLAYNHSLLAVLLKQQEEEQRLQGAPNANGNLSSAGAFAEGLAPGVRNYFMARLLLRQNPGATVTPYSDFYTTPAD